MTTSAPPSAAPAVPLPTAMWFDVPSIDHGLDSAVAFAARLPVATPWLGAGPLRLAVADAVAQPVTGLATDRPVRIVNWAPDPDRSSRWVVVGTIGDRAALERDVLSVNRVVIGDRVAIGDAQALADVAPWAIATLPAAPARARFHLEVRHFHDDELLQNLGRGVASGVVDHGNTPIAAALGDDLVAAMHRLYADAEAVDLELDASDTRMRIIAEIHARRASRLAAWFAAQRPSQLPLALRITPTDQVMVGRLAAGPLRDSLVAAASHWFAARRGWPDAPTQRTAIAALLGAATGEFIVTSSAVVVGLDDPRGAATAADALAAGDRDAANLAVVSDALAIALRLEDPAFFAAVANLGAAPEPWPTWLAAGLDRVRATRPTLAILWDTSGAASVPVAGDPVVAVTVDVKPQRATVALEFTPHGAWGLIGAIATRRAR